MRPFRLVLALALTLPSASAADYVIAELPALSPFNTRAQAVNDAGRVVGSGNLPSLALHAVSWDDLTATDLGEPGNPLSQAYGVSPGGIVAGDERNIEGITEAALWIDGSVQFLGTLPNHLGSRAHDANDAGLVVGWSTSDTGIPRAVVWQDGVIQPISTGESWALATNSSGVVVGRRNVGVEVQAFRWAGGLSAPLADLGAGIANATSISDSGLVGGSARHPDDVKNHAVIWDGSGAITDLGLLDGTHPTVVNDVNDAGVAVGSALIDPVSGETRAVLFRDGQVIDLNSLIPGGTGWTLHDARSINDRGQIVGYGIRDSQPAVRSFFLGVDCNDNGLDDAQEVLTGTAFDANSNGVPDVCEHCQTNLGFQGPGVAELSVCGDELVGVGTFATISLTGAPPFAPLILVLGFTNLPTPAKGGILVPVPPAILLSGLATAADGTLAFGTGGGGRLPVPVYIQFVAINGTVFEFSNAVEMILGV